MKTISWTLDREMNKPSDIRALVPVDDCRAIIAALERADAPCEPAQASKLTRRLLSCYPQRDEGLQDAEGYVSAIAATLARFPIAAASRACSIDKGLPAKLKYRPTPADVTEHCEAEVRRIRELRGAAQWMLDERTRREEARRQEADGPTPEERERNVARVDELLKGFRGKR